MASTTNPIPAAKATTKSIDTNIILRLILGDVPAQRVKAIELLNRQDIKYRVSGLAITEVVFVMQKLGYARQEIANELQRLLSLDNLKYNEALFNKVFQLYLAHPALSFNDCYLAVAAEFDDATPLITFDRKLARQLPQAEELA